jgi:hypothetical protein
MPEGVLSMARVLEQDARRAVSLTSGKIREPRRLYEAERMAILKQLNLSDDAKSVTQVVRSKHLGAFARRSRNGSTKVPKNGRVSAIEKFNAGRDAEFGDNLARLSKTIGDHLAENGHVPDGVWTEFEGLNKNRRFFRKTHDDATMATPHAVGPGSYQTKVDIAPGGKISGADAPVRRRNDAQLEATDRLKHKESIFRLSKDYGTKEQGHLERLYEEIGRPRFSYKRGDRNYEEHLEKYAYRHMQMYSHRSLNDVKVLFRPYLFLNTALTLVDSFTRTEFTSA